MDFSLTEEQKAFRATLREFFQQKYPREVDRQLDDAEDFPYKLYSDMAMLGILGVAVPEEFGGIGGGLLDAVVVAEELGQVCQTASHIFNNVLGFGTQLIYRNANEEQKRTYLPMITKGQKIFSFALTEPEAGSDAAAVQSTAVPCKEGYLINGAKRFITGAHVANYIMTVARTNKEAKKHRGLTIFIVATPTPGLSTRRLHKLGATSNGTNEVFYDDVKVPIDMILGGPECLDKGWESILKILDIERLSLAARAAGTAKAAFDYTIAYAKERQQFDQPIGKFQAIQHYFADMATNISAAQLLTYHAAWLKTQNMPCLQEAAMAKLFACETAKKVCVQCMQIMGGMGYMMECDIQRYLRNSLLWTIGGGTSEIQKNIIARSLDL